MALSACYPAARHHTPKTEYNQMLIPSAGTILRLSPGTRDKAHARDVLGVAEAGVKTSCWAPLEWIVKPLSGQLNKELRLREESRAKF